jgi:hypothetical protein
MRCSGAVTVSPTNLHRRLDGERCRTEWFKTKTAASDADDARSNRQARDPVRKIIEHGPAGSMDGAEGTGPPHRPSAHRLHERAAEHAAHRVERSEVSTHRARPRRRGRHHSAREQITATSSPRRHHSNTSHRRHRTRRQTSDHATRAGTRPDQLLRSTCGDPDTVALDLRRGIASLHVGVIGPDRARTTGMTTRQRVIGYARCSTMMQAEDGTTLDQQRAKIAAWCALHDAEQVCIEVDSGISGRAMANRPALQRPRCAPLGSREHARGDRPVAPHPQDT